MKTWKQFNENIQVTEDKIIKFSEYTPTKYNGNVLVSQIMEWLRAKLLEEPSADQVTYSLPKFFNESGVNKSEFMTFYNEIDKTQKAKNFKVEIDGINITFSDFKNNEDVDK